MKILLEYDPATGAISDKTGMQIGVWVGLAGYEYNEETNQSLMAAKPKVSDLVELKNAGFTADEIIALNIKGAL